MACYIRKMFGEDEEAGTDWMDLAKGVLGLGTALAGGGHTTPAATPYVPGVQPKPVATVKAAAISTSTILLLGGAAIAVYFLTKKAA